jgi:arylsulfatase A-like enzyme
MMKSIGRTKTILFGGVLGAALFAWSATPAVLAAAPAQKPNILLIIADDLNDWIGPMAGHPQARTPNLDKLAARGVTFRNAQCAAPLCNPSRAAFMSGIRPSTTGIYHNHQVWMPHIGRGLCINDYVRKFGYTSLGAGKIYHYRNYRAEDWDEVVFAADDTLPNHPASRRPGPFGYRMFTEGEPQQPFDEKRPESRLVDAQSVSWCIERLGQVKQPFFMACGLHRPHTPWDVPKKYFDLNPLDTIQLPAVLTNDLADVAPPGVEFANRAGAHATILRMGLWQDRVRAYLAAVSYADAQVGRLLDVLAKSPGGENTIIVFVGDNGWHLGQKEHWGKVTLWNEATCVPMIWVAPGVAKAGVKCEQAVDLMSLYPTLCELAGVPTPKHAEGVSIKPLLANPSAPWSHPALSTMYKDNHTLRTAEWRYIHYADGSEELYNERTDPHEWMNVAGKPEYADVKAKLAKYLPAKNAEPVPATEAPAKKKNKKGKKAQAAK